MLVYVSCWPLLAWLAGKLIPAIGQGNTKQVLTVILQALIIFIIQKTAQYLQDSLLAKPALALSQDLRTTLFKKLQKTNILFIENNSRRTSRTRSFSRKKLTKKKKKKKKKKKLFIIMF